jgi:hypothetical protein
MKTQVMALKVLNMLEITSSKFDYESSYILTNWDVTFV